MGSKTGKKERRRLGDRRDGKLVRDLDSLHVLMPYMYPNRTDCEAFISDTVELAPISEYLKKKNAGVQQKFSIFQLIAVAVGKTIILRPKMNRFISGYRLYQRKDVTVSFVVKQAMSEDADEGLAFLKINPDSTVDTIHEDLLSQITLCRSESEKDNSTENMDVVKKLPAPIVRAFMWLMRKLDFKGRIPASLIETDPTRASVFMTNLGSIGLRAGYHHLTNWGTNSVFIVIGNKHRAPIFDDDGNFEMREVLDIGITLDERIADGYYFAKTIKLLKYLLKNPELLELPMETPVTNA